jgi:hypothetical protein
VSWFAILGLPSHPNVYLMPVVVVSTIYITVAGLYVIAEPESLSRRISRSLPRSHLARALWVPFLPGGTRGLLFGLGSLSVMALAAWIAFKLGLDRASLHSTSNEMLAAETVIGYAAIYLGIGALLTRVCRRVMRNFSPGHLIAILVLGNLLLILMDELWHFLSNFRDNSFQPIDVVNPFTAVDAIARGQFGSQASVLAVAIAAALAVAVNWRAMRHAIREVLNNPVRSQIELAAAHRKQAQAGLLEATAS